MKDASAGENRREAVCGMLTYLLHLAFQKWPTDVLVYRPPDDCRRSPNTKDERSLRAASELNSGSIH